VNQSSFPENVTQASSEVPHTLPKGLAMLSEVKSTVFLWSLQMQRYLRNELIDLEPHEYCIGAVFVIAIGFVLMSGRR